MLSDSILTRPAPRVRALLFAAASLLAAQAHAFSIDDVADEARKLAGESYVAPTSNLPAQFRDMQYADYQRIRYRADQYQWHDIDSRFKLSFYHQGMHFNTPVKINEVTATSVHEIKYDPARFDFGDLKFDKDATSKLGYAGFRVMYPINEAGKQDEIMSLLGASYFRLVGKDQWWGLSARGLAIDTALPSGEEFPYFKEFWIEQPKAKDKHLVIYALLDSPRATGAYRFVLRPELRGDAVLDVQGRVFLRDKVSKLGIAPLTSMFLYGPNQPSEVHNYRPAIHDSNGLSTYDGSGKWTWRPLTNPRRLAVNTWQLDSPKGFGLLQRGRDFSRYEDLDDRYDQRPSAWIEPKGDWGKGHVELVEIPTPDETNDNIVAFWTPDEQPAPGEPLDFAYRMYWTLDERGHHAADNAWVKQTLRSEGEVKQPNLIRELDGSTALLVDFVGPALSELPADAPVTTQVSTDDNTELMENNLRYNPITKGWRLTLRFKVKDHSKPTKMDATLIKDGQPLSETWDYLVPADEIR